MPVPTRTLSRLTPALLLRVAAAAVRNCRYFPPSPGGSAGFPPLRQRPPGPLSQPAEVSERHTPSALRVAGSKHTAFPPTFSPPLPLPRPATATRKGQARLRKDGKWSPVQASFKARSARSAAGRRESGGQPLSCARVCVFFPRQARFRASCRRGSYREITCNSGFIFFILT